MLKTSVKLLFGFMIMSSMVSLLTACNTTAGAGKDVSSVGHAVTDSAERNK